MQLGDNRELAVFVSQSNNDFCANVNGFGQSELGTVLRRFYQMMPGSIKLKSQMPQDVSLPFYKHGDPLSVAAM